MLRLTWPASWLVAAAWWVLYVADAIEDTRTKLLNRKNWRHNAKSA